LALSNNLKTITKNDVVLSDYHRVLKLVKTLAFIEKYQNEAKPQVKLYEDFITEQINMVEKIKTQTPKY
jgi:ubiquinone/menaquinone biosynthesis C-methylase UbiE